MVDVEDLKSLAKQASSEVMKIYNGTFSVEFKTDNSPLTKADLKANDIICKGLQKIYPHIPIISEENTKIDYSKRKDWEYYFCIDPIDGTKEFIQKNGEFTINIALIHRNTPLMGVVFAPVFDDMYWSDGQKSYKNNQVLPIYKNNNIKENLKVAISRSHLTDTTIDFINTLDSKNITQIQMGSSLKLCMVAEGSFDIYPKLSDTMEWDTAAADAIVRSAGKMTYQLKTNTALTYNKKELLNPHFIVR